MVKQIYVERKGVSYWTGKPKVWREKVTPIEYSALKKMMARENKTYGRKLFWIRKIKRR
jgi:hypothetical protein